jgi:peptidoglycan-associated lipoprotein
MSNKKLALIVCLILSLVLVVGACKKKQQPDVTADQASEAAQPVQEPEADTEPPVAVEDFQTPEPEVEEISQTAAEINTSGALKIVYFAYDKSDLTDTARSTLRQNANWMKANQPWAIKIEGHCDERGTIEYNLALGQRRANTLRDYYTSLGVSTSRLRTISFGEERPADPGHTEASWAKNRRGVTLVEKR